MNVLQHMNQPTGPCYNGSTPLFDDSVDLVVPPSHATVQPQQEDFELGVPDHEDPISYEDIKMNDITSNSPNDPPVPLLPRPGVEQLCPGQFVETFEGCGETFPGGKTFMDDFWADQYVEERCDKCLLSLGIEAGVGFCLLVITLSSQHGGH